MYLYEKWISKSQGALQVLSEGIVQETRLTDLLVTIFIHYELSGLTRRIDNERITVEAL